MSEHAPAAGAPHQVLESRSAESTSDPRLSVVIATYNRAASAERLLTELAAQSLASTQFEVIVVDDGSSEPVRPRLEHLSLPYRLLLLAQPNAGPGAARHAGVQHALGDVIVIVDDDMWLPTGFLQAHLDAHPAGSRRVALGPFRTVTKGRVQVHQRLGERTVQGALTALHNDGVAVPGTRLYTGNVSFRRSDYLAVGGFDSAFRISEDAELGVRLARAGVTFIFAEDAATTHESDRSDVRNWMRRSIAYGRADSQLATKHPGDALTSPWRFLWRVSAVSRPMLILGAIAPPLMRPIAALALLTARAADRVGLAKLGVLGVTFAYGLLYFRGVREHAGSLPRVLHGLREYLNLAPPGELGFFAKYAKACADTIADHEALRRAAEKYKGTVVPASRLPLDFVQRIGFQMMGVYRLMRFFRTAGLTFLAKVTSRLMRHMYGADIHWDADFAPGVILVHGLGLVVAPDVRVATGCVLFQNVTLGANIHPDTRATGVPVLEADVHVGPGAAILGPITIGAGTKITANALVMRSVPPRSLVEVGIQTVRPRPAGRSTPATS